MSEYMFGVSHRRLSARLAKKVDAIAKRHGAYLVTAALPGTGYQRWFCGPNYGAPFDQQMADAVYADLAIECPEALDRG